MSESMGSNGEGSGDPSALLAQATQLINANRLGEAKTICDRLVRANRDDVGALYALGWIAQSTQDFQTACEHYRRVIDLTPDHARAQNNLGVVLLRTGDMPGAKQHFEAAIALEPAFTEALGNLGSIQLLEGAVDEARRNYEKALEAAPDSPLAHLGLGQVFYFQNAYKDAEAELTKALQSVPDHVEALAILARVKLGLGAFEDGERLLRRAAGLSPKNYRLFVELGDLYRLIEKRGDAVGAYISALRIKPDFVTTLSRLSYFTREELGLDLRGAIEHAREELPRFDNGARLRLQFASARAFDQAQDYDKAWPEAVKANADFRNHYGIDTSAQTEFAKQPSPLLGSPPDSAGTAGASGRPRLVFIVGLPRSGKSTTEKLMGNIPGVILGYESARLFAAMEAFSNRIASSPEGQSGESLAALRSEFQGIFDDALANCGGAGSTYTITISHLRFLNLIPNILRIMPDASVILVDRDIWDNALRLFFCNYKTGLFTYSYRLSSIMDNIRLFRSAMEWWSETEPDRCLALGYEDLIADPNAALARICGFCDLPLPDTPLAPMFDDREAAAPYRNQMENLLAEEDA